MGNFIAEGYQSTNFVQTFLRLEVFEVAVREYKASSIFHYNIGAFGYKTSARNVGGANMHKF